MPVIPGSGSPRKLCLSQNPGSSSVGHFMTLLIPFSYPPHDPFSYIGHTCTYITSIPLPVRFLPPSPFILSAGTRTADTMNPFLMGRPSTPYEVPTLTDTEVDEMMARFPVDRSSQRPSTGSRNIGPVCNSQNRGETGRCRFFSFLQFPT